MGIEFELAGSQIDGARDYQEDAFLITHLTDDNDNPSALIIVADGMGGHAAGNVASNLAVQTCNKYVAAHYPASKEKIGGILEEAIIQANEGIRETIAETSALKGMGCTMVVAMLEKGWLFWASVGDSHLYVIRDGKLIKKNLDHSYGGFLDRMKAQGKEMQPEPGLSRNMLMSALTGQEITDVDVSLKPFPVLVGDRIVVCSDGVDSLPSKDLLDVAEWASGAKDYADGIMDAVKQKNIPRQDNTTAVVVNVVSAAIEAEKAEREATLTSRTHTGYYGGDLVAEKQSSGGKFGKILTAFFVVAILLAGGYFFLQPEPIKRVPDETITDTAVKGDTEDIVQKDSESVIQTIVQDQASVDPKQAQKQQSAKAKADVKQEKVSKIFRDTLKSGGQGPEMIIVPAGSFQMGSARGRRVDEYPRHKVVLKSFAVSRHEVTFAQYDRFAQALGKKKPDSLYLDRKNHPVIFVSWDDAYGYAKWLSKETGKRYRLLSEAEWEYMASTGKQSSFWWGYEAEPNRAHCFGCGSSFDPRKPTKIASFVANAFGIYDTAGNVAEWVQDCWHKDYDNAPDDGSVWEGGDCVYRVVRGGSFSSPPQSLRSAKRDRFKSDHMYDNIGIRVARDIP